MQIQKWRWPSTLSLSGIRGVLISNAEKELIFWISEKNTTEDRRKCQLQVWGKSRAHFPGNAATSMNHPRSAQKESSQRNRRAETFS
mmetsp:Transcript_11093/g.16802  ORF Transcript_11093/g.16802 Transcript_11093/m.16802 type:complete len:87 (+) Transcript_11093:73-333(+)